MKKLMSVVVPISLALVAFSHSFSFAARKAMLVGVGDYQALTGISVGGIRDLRGPVNDVEFFRKMLVSRFGFSESNIRILVNENARKRDIEKTFHHWLVKGTSKDDIVFFYFSGHGSKIPDFNSDESDGEDEVLLPHDMVPDGGYNIIVDDEMGLWLKKLEGRNVTVVIDSCYSGGVTRKIGSRIVSESEETVTWAPRFVPITDYDPPSATRGIPTGPDVPEWVVFMAASKEDQTAIEIRTPSGFHGGFSFSLQDGIDNLEAPSYEELFSHAHKVVKDRLKLVQEPQIMAKKEVLGKPFLDPPEVRPPAVDVNIPPPPPPPITVDGPPVSKPPLAEQKPPVTVQPSIVSNESRPLAPSVPDAVKPPSPQVLEDAKPSGNTTAAPSPTPEDATASPPLPEADNAPTPPPEMEGEKIIAAIDELKGWSAEEKDSLKKRLSNLSHITLASPEDFHDRLIRGEKRAGKYSLRLLNLTGDVEKAGTADNLQDITAQVISLLDSAYMAKRLAWIRNPRPAFRVTLSVPDGRRDYEVGERIIYGVQSERDAYLIVLNLDSTGNFNVIFPNKFQKDNFVKANTPLLTNKKYEFLFAPPAGEETVKVLAMTRPVELERIGLKEFDGMFATIAGQARDIMIQGLTESIDNNLNDTGFEWAEDTIVVRSHEKQ